MVLAHQDEVRILGGELTMWNYRVVKCKSDLDGSDEYAIREVYYNDDNSLLGYVHSPEGVFSESLEGLREVIEWMQTALISPVIDVEEFGGADETDLESAT
jgi:hypothetical protein